MLWPTHGRVIVQFACHQLHNRTGGRNLSDVPIASLQFVQFLRSQYLHRGPDLLYHAYRSIWQRIRDWLPGSWYRLVEHNILFRSISWIQFLDLHNYEQSLRRRRLLRRLHDRQRLHQCLLWYVPSWCQLWLRQTLVPNGNGFSS